MSGAQAAYMGWPGDGLARLGRAKPAGQGRRDAAEVHQAAVAFEAVLLGQLVQELHITGDEESGFQGPGSDVLRSLIESSLADALARQGGVGIADMLAKSLGAGAAGAGPSVAGSTGSGPNPAGPGKATPAEGEAKP